VCVVEDHLDVGGHDGDKEGDESPGGCGAGGREEETEAAEDLAEAAEVDQLEMPRETGGHDPDVGLRNEEVEGSGGDEEEREEDAEEH